MKNFRYLWIFIILISCNSPEPAVLKTIAVDISAKPDFPFSHFFEISKTVELETSENSVVSNIRKIIDTGERIFILTWGEAQIIMFDPAGQFLGKIDRNGKGPEEYIYVVDFDIDIRNQLICLYDKRLKTILYYDFEGRFVKKVKTDLDLESFSIRPDGTILGFSFLNRMKQIDEMAHRFWIIDKSGNVISKQLPIPSTHLGMTIGVGSSFYRSLNETFFIPFIGDTIYSIQHNATELKPRFFLDLSIKSFQGDIYSQTRKEFRASFNESCIFYGEFMGQSKYMLNYITTNGSPEKPAKKGRVLIDIDQNIISNISGNILIDEVNELPLHFGHQQTSPNKLIAIVQPFELKEFQFDNPKSIGQKLVNKLDEDDNPILVYYDER